MVKELTIIIFSSLFDINDNVFINHIIIESDKFRVKFKFDGFLEIILVWFSLNSHLIFNTRRPKIYIYTRPLSFPPIPTRVKKIMQLEL